MDVLDKIGVWRSSSDKDDHGPWERPHVLKVKVISKRTNSPPTMSTFSCLSSDTDFVLLERLRGHYRRVYTRGWFSTLLSFVLMRKLYLGFAMYRVSLSTTDLEAQFIHCPVRILETEIEETLTAAFHNPKNWFHGRDLASSLFKLDNSRNLPPWKGKALYMTELFDRGRARSLVAFSLLAIIICGLVAGFIFHSLAVGLAVSGALSAWISCVQFLLLRQYP